MINKEEYDNGFRCKGVCNLKNIMVCKDKDVCYQYKMFLEESRGVDDESN